MNKLNVLHIKGAVLKRLIIFENFERKIKFVERERGI